MKQYLNNHNSKEIVSKLLSIKKQDIEYGKDINNISLNMLYKLVLDIKTSINKFYIDEKTLIAREINNNDFLDNNSILNDLKSKYISSKIRDHIFTNRTSNHIIYKYTGKISYNINFIVYTNSLTSTYLNYLDMCALNIFSIIDFLETYRQEYCKIDVLDIYIFLTDFKKTLPKESSIIGPENVNTGFTSPCKNTTRIIIYRKEEFMKVTIHELVHALGLDMPNTLYEKYTNSLDKFFGIESTYIFNETYTEVWALIINVLYFVAINNDDSTDREVIKKQIQDLLNIEIQFSSLQVAKILNYMDISLSQLKHHKKNKNFKEETNVFCYYIIKYVLIYNINLFLDICKTNINFTDKKQVDVDEKKLNLLLDIIYSFFNSSSNLEKFNIIEKDFRDNLSSNISNILLQNLRMTSIELA